MERWWNVFTFHMTSIIMWAMFWIITKGLEQNLSIILQESHIIAILENPSKDDLTNSKENNYCRFHFSKFWCFKPKTLPKKTPSRFFWEGDWNFVRVDIKNNSYWIAQSMLSKEVSIDRYQTRWSLSSGKLVEV